MENNSTGGHAFWKAIRYLFSGLGLVVLGLVGYVVYVEMLVRYWDRKIDALCAADDGKNVGLRVYERVMAPESYIRPASWPQPADIKVPWRFKGSVVRDNEPIVEELVEFEVLRAENPRVSRYATRITRIADERVLAEEIKYMRGGGGMPMPDPGESHICPESKTSRINTRALYSEVFINHPLNQPQGALK